jgi:RNA polymerase sigma factor (TIGR02999 family)
MNPEQQEVAAALALLRQDAEAGMERLIPLVYDELRHVAHRQLAQESAGHTLCTTALVHEAYMRLAAQTRVEWAERAQFFAIAARVMRRILIDYARRHTAQRRGGDMRRVPLEEADGTVSLSPEGIDDLIGLDDALERLATVDERLARVVECRFFAGLTDAETAEALGISQRTVARDWVIAKGWLYGALRGEGS